MIKWQKIIGGSSTPLQPSTAPKTPAAVQKVPSVGSLPFNETIKGPLSPSIDFSHSFSDKFELIIQCQVPGDVYFQHEGQLIHSVTPPTPNHNPPHSFFSTAISHFTSTPLAPSSFAAVSLDEGSQQVVWTRETSVLLDCLPHCLLTSCSLCDFCPHVTSGVNFSANWGLIYSKVLDGGGRSLLPLRANGRWRVSTLPLRSWTWFREFGFCWMFLLQRMLWLFSCTTQGKWRKLVILWRNCKDMKQRGNTLK